jgi:transposase
MRRIVLTQSEIEKLGNLHKYSDNLVERRHAQQLLLSNQGYSMSKVAKITGVCYQSIANLLNAWEAAESENRFSILRTAKGQGAKLKLQGIEKEIPVLMEKNDRNLNFVLDDIEKQFGIKISKLTLRNFLKYAGI